eukprot:CAMPEP_0184720840 /NCGR_PEP_ID=MMETSP0314-20130426/15466_1 /TAXON_ID=38298 /ORGANISM="Rhodella maculata, Strain CCMP 736" /LENGTH=45 /DNA_ID= /DNA_START= /DNA_END= /DNA_ORIENTATION=
MALTFASGSAKRSASASGEFFSGAARWSARRRGLREAGMKAEGEG